MQLIETHVTATKKKVISQSLYTNQNPSYPHVHDLLLVAQNQCLSFDRLVCLAGECLLHGQERSSKSLGIIGSPQRSARSERV